MIYSITGTIISKKENFAVVAAGGLGYKVFCAPRVHEALPSAGEDVHLYCYFHVREQGQELYGFLRESDLMFFEKLLTVNGVGPKSGLAIMALATSEDLAAAINEGKPDLLTRAAGVGKKTAERVVLELHGKLPVLHSEETTRRMESDADVEEALTGLGYSSGQAKKVLREVDPALHDLEARLRAALKLLKK